MMFDISQNHGVVWENKSGDATVTIYNEKEEEIKDLTFQDTDIINILTFS